VVKGRDLARTGRELARASSEDRVRVEDFFAYVEAWEDPHDLEDQDVDERRENDRDLETV
jgi:hypothetical protein